MHLSVTLFPLAVFFQSQYTIFCQAAMNPLTDPKKEGYSKLIRKIRSHSIAQERIPPVVTGPSYPPYNTGKTGIDVNLNVMPLDIVQLDPATQVLEISGFLSLHWYDTDLAWNQSDYGGVSMVEIPSTDLWTPTLSVMNGRENNDILIDERISISILFNGFLTLAFSLNLKTSCTMDLTYFPFDTQSCDIVFMNNVQSIMNLKLSDMGISHIFQDLSVGGEWILTDTIYQNEVILNEYLQLTASKMTLNLRRKTTFYMVSVVGPMGLFTAMNCLVFLIPPESGEKTAFLVSLFISNTIFTSFTNGVMPRTLDKQIPLIMIYLLFMWIWSTVIILETIFVLQIFHKEQAKDSDRSEPAGDCGKEKQRSVKEMLSRPQNWLKSAFIRENRVGTSKCDTPPSHQPQGPKGIRESQAYSTDLLADQTTDCALADNHSKPNNCSPLYKAKVLITAKILDRIFFALNVIIVLAFDAIIIVLNIH